MSRVFKTRMNARYPMYLPPHSITLFTLIFTISCICIFCILLSMPLSAIAAPVPDTGQFQSYTTVYGEDSDYAINTPSYTKLDAEARPLAPNAASWVMVHDNYTRLTWEVKSDDGTIHDTHDQYAWQDAQDIFIQALNDANFGGFNDWRIPTVKELSTIVNSGRYNPAINTKYFPNTQSSNYWSSTSYAGYTGDAWSVSFRYGTVNNPAKLNKYYIRAVRGGQASNVFIDNGDGTVTDTSTGLMWQQETAGEMSWTPAINYCESLILAGYDDWRLPNRNELQSIMDYSTYSPAIDTTAFPGTLSSDYWSSTPAVLYSNGAWRVGFGSGGIAGNYAMSNSFYVRAVRGGQAELFGDLVVAVTDADSGLAVADANVVLIDQNLIVDRIAGLTSSSGEASLIDILFGMYDLTITATGYLSLDVPVTVFYAGAMTIEYVLTPCALSIYEDAEDGLTKGWGVYDQDPEGSTIINVYDADANSLVIELSGSGTENGYYLLTENGRWWRQADSTVVQWSMKYSEDYAVYFLVHTSLGARYVTYTPSDTDRLGTGLYAVHGLGSGTRDGQWHTYTRDLQADLQRAQPGAAILSVNAFYIRGSGRVDDIIMLYGIPYGLDSDADGLTDADEIYTHGTNPSRPDTDNDGLTDGEEITQGTDPTDPTDPCIYEDAEDGLTLGWDIYDQTPEGAQVSNLYDTEKGSNVIQLSGSGTQNGYLLRKENRRWWQNSRQHIVQWSMRYAEAFTVYLRVTTDQGIRFLTYTPKDLSYLGTGLYVNYGLGSGVTDGEWHTFTRDLQADLSVAQPGTNIVTVDAFYIRGSGMVDDIQLRQSMP